MNAAMGVAEGGLPWPRQPTESLSDEHLAVARRWFAVDQLVPEALVRPLGVMMGDVLPQHALEVALSAQEPDFGHDIAQAVEEVIRVTEPVPKERLAAIAAVTGLPEDLLGGVQPYRGITASGAREHRVVLLQVPLPAPLDGCHLTVAVSEDGRARGMGAWGNDELDADPTLRWSLFLSQLVRSEAAKKVDGTLLKAKVKSAVEAIDADRQRLVQGLLAQRLIMQWNGMVVRQLRLLDDRGESPDFAAVRPVARAMTGLASKHDVFAEFLGDDQGAEYRELAAATAKVLTEMSELSPAASPNDALRKVRSELLGKACSQCHDSKTTDEQRTFQSALRTARRDLGLPAGVFLVGYDVAPALGDDGKRSQVLASAARAGLLIAREVWKQKAR